MEPCTALDSLCKTEHDNVAIDSTRLFLTINDPRHSSPFNASGLPRANLAVSKECPFGTQVRKPPRMIRGHRQQRTELANRTVQDNSADGPSLTPYTFKPGMLADSRMYRQTTGRNNIRTTLPCSR